MRRADIVAEVLLPVEVAITQGIKKLGVRLDELIPTRSSLSIMQVSCMRVSNRDSKNVDFRGNTIERLWHGIGKWRA